MPYGKHHIPGTHSKRIGYGRITRYRFSGSVMHQGQKMRQRIGFSGNKVVEVAFVPIRKKYIKKYPKSRGTWSNRDQIRMFIKYGW